MECLKRCIPRLAHVASTGNMYEYTSENRKGEKEKKEYYLDERDPLWVNLRHQFIADASNNVTKQLNNFMSQNKATGVSLRATVPAGRCAAAGGGNHALRVGADNNGTGTTRTAMEAKVG